MDTMKICVNCVCKLHDDLFWHRTTRMFLFKLKLKLYKLKVLCILKSWETWYLSYLKIQIFTLLLFNELSTNVGNVMFGYWQAKNLRSCFKNFHLYYDHLMIPLFTKLSKCNYLLSFMIDHCMIEKYQPKNVLISVIPVWLNHFHVSWMIEKPSKLSNCINHFFMITVWLKNINHQNSYYLSFLCD